MWGVLSTFLQPILKRTCRSGNSAWLSLTLPSQAPCDSNASNCSVAVARSSEAQMRERCVDFMEAHREDFEPFIDAAWWHGFWARVTCTPP